MTAKADDLVEACQTRIARLRRQIALRLHELQYEPVAAIAQLGHTEVARVVGAAEHRALSGQAKTGGGGVFHHQSFFNSVKRFRVLIAAARRR